MRIPRIVIYEENSLTCGTASQNCSHKEFPGSEWQSCRRHTYSLRKQENLTQITVYISQKFMTIFFIKRHHCKIVIEISVHSGTYYQ